MLSSLYSLLNLTVNPTIGTSGVGHTFPGAVAPFGMVQVSPETWTKGQGWKYCSGYQHGQEINRVSLTHLSGTGIGSAYDIGFIFEPFLPIEELLIPGYYSASNGDKFIEMTTHDRCAYIRYRNLKLETDLISSFNYGRYVSHVDIDGQGFIKKSGWSDYTIYFNYKRYENEIIACIDYHDVPNFSTDNFETAFLKTHVLWTKHLQKIESSSVILNTALYHCLIHPSQYSNDEYTIFSTWDTFRAWNSLMIWLYPSYINKWTKSLMRSKYLPIWEIYGTDSQTMSGTHSISLIGEYILKGYLSPHAVFHNMTVWDKILHTLTRPDRYYEYYYSSLGYIPCEISKVSVSMQLEHAYVDSVLQAIQLKYNLDSPIKFNPNSYKSLFSKHSQGDMFYPRYYGGSFNYNNYDRIDNGFDEGSAISYRFSVLHDFAGLIQLYGDNPYIYGCSKLFPCEEKLNGNMKRELDNYFDDNKGTIQGQLQDLSHCFGNFCVSNEISLHAPFFYTVLGFPEKTCEWMIKIGELFTSNPNGIPGNSDVGSLDSFYIFLNLGFMQINPSSGIFILGCPITDESIRVGKVYITRSGEGYNPKYFINNMPYNKLYITHRMLVNGFHLHVSLTP